MTTLAPPTEELSDLEPSPAQVEPVENQRSRTSRAVRRVFDTLAPDREAVVPAAPPSRKNVWEIKLLALVSLGVYSFVGWWLRHYLHFAVGDALARTANAKYMLFSRDPHFAALGFVWMPIPTVSQIPAMLIAEPLGYAADAGWVTTAIWGAITVLVLGRMGRDLRLPRLTVLILCLAYAFNPVIVYYAANGMSEGPLFTFIAVTFWGLFRYLDRGDSMALILTAIGLTGCALDRYEAIPLIFATGGILLVADLRRTGRRSAVLATVLATVPALGSVFAWFVYMRVIKGSFRAFITDAAGNQVAAAAPVTAPVAAAAPAAAPAPGPGYTFYKNVADGEDWLHFTLHWCFAYAPALFLLPLLLFPPFRKSFGAAALIFFAVWLPGVTAYLLRFGGSSGDPRYFTSVIVTTTVGVFFLASRLNIKLIKVVVHPLLVLALAVGWVTGTHAQYDRAATNQEGEYRVFDVAKGEIDRGDAQQIEAWQRFAKVLDADLKPGQLVFDDVRYGFEAELYSRKAAQFIINNDADFESIRSNPYELPNIHINYLIVPAPGARGDGIDYGQTILGSAPQDWQQITSPGPELLYKRIAGVAGPAPAVGVEGTTIRG